jgi:hypothetical protein
MYYINSPASFDMYYADRIPVSRNSSGLDNNHRSLSTRWLFAMLRGVGKVERVPIRRCRSQTPANSAASAFPPWPVPTPTAQR